MIRIVAIAAFDPYISIYIFVWAMFHKELIFQIHGRLGNNTTNVAFPIKISLFLCLFPAMNWGHNGKRNANINYPKCECYDVSEACDTWTHGGMCWMSWNSLNWLFIIVMTLQLIFSWEGTTHRTLFNTYKHFLVHRKTFQNLFTLGTFQFGVPLKICEHCYFETLEKP